MWQQGETYLLLSLGFVYGWNCLALIFGWCHCIFLFCGEPLLMQRCYHAEASWLWGL